MDSTTNAAGCLCAKYSYKAETYLLAKKHVRTVPKRIWSTMIQMVGNSPASCKKSKLDPRSPAQVRLYFAHYHVHTFPTLHLNLMIGCRWISQVIRYKLPSWTPTDKTGCFPAKSSCIWGSKILIFLLADSSRTWIIKYSLCHNEALLITNKICNQRRTHGQGSEQSSGSGLGWQHTAT